MHWVNPVWYRELDEFLRLPEFKIWPWHFVWMYLRGKLIDLDDETWSNMRGTDSWRAIDMQEVRGICVDHQELDWDIYKVSQALEEAFTILSLNKKVFAPIVIKSKDGSTRLLSGNRRLMMARANNIRPKCFMLVK